MRVSSLRYRAAWPVVAALYLVLLQTAGAESHRILVLPDDEVDQGDFLPQDDCIVHDFTPVGQALHASGSTGGLFPYREGQVYRDSSAFSMLLSSNRDVDVIRALEQTSDAVVILVLDDFRITEGSSETYRINDADLTTSTDAASFIKRVSHGSMVMAHINALIRDTGKYTLLGTSSNGERTLWMRGNKHLDVVGVQLPGQTKDGYVLFDADTIGPALDTDGYSSVVVNMSWVILPCLNVVDFYAYWRSGDPSPTFNDYLAELRTQGWDSPESFAPETPGGDWLQRGDAIGNVTFVASAGNQALHFELYPAAFSDVISVGALDADDYSNAAQVKATGGWFPLSYLCCDGATISLPVSDLPSEGLAYAGTSYAAPSMSVLAAIHADKCAHKNEIQELTWKGYLPMYFARDVCD
jgi:hypothetical protein